MNLLIWQAIYLVSAAVILPISPFLFLLGQHTRRKVGLLPDAAARSRGRGKRQLRPAKLFVIGESTVAGLGARTHNEGLTEDFAEQFERTHRQTGRVDRSR